MMRVDAGAEALGAGPEVSSGLVAFFGHDRVEPTIRKRVGAIRHAGWSVIEYMFVRARDGLADLTIVGDAVPLGRTVDRHYGRRLPVLALGVVRALRRWRDLRAADVVYVRNLDMALVAWASVRLAGSRAPLVYEVLDIQRLMVRPDSPGRLARAVERWILGRCALLVVSSPDFVTRYFEPVQGFAGAWHLLENKVMAHRLGEVAHRLDRDRLAGPPWVIGWFGTLRCSRSLTILAGIAGALGNSVRIVIAGRLSEEDIDPRDLAETLSRHPNMSFRGPYANPVELPDIYEGVHFSWAVDYLDDGLNSDWLLPNRLYEGGLCGALTLARADTATGRYAVSERLGWAFPEPLEHAVIAFLRTLDGTTYTDMQSRLVACELSKFVDVHGMRDLLDRIA
ncbi:glucosyl transferase [Methylobacterium sp. NEAU K]|uniref:glucosyl transferase n=1 Tax=Methylobacterium sp. NEAU K TaxID=3064946 RepID=UPI002732CD99|nr:glucosyl transferase [Methylobacterium sp. NEAU K]MDP4005831.1 glucosyl transferase [Methylobacterium sp. NEAU K]